MWTSPSSELRTPITLSTDNPVVIDIFTHPIPDLYSSDMFFLSDWSPFFDSIVLFCISVFPPNHDLVLHLGQRAGGLSVREYHL